MAAKAQSKHDEFIINNLPLIVHTAFGVFAEDVSLCYQMYVVSTCFFLEKVVLECVG